MMKQRLLMLATVFVVSLSMIGCTTVQKSMAVGAGLGAAVGGIWGAQAGGDLSAGEGALVGAVTGATVGALVGDQLQSASDQKLSDQIREKDKQIQDLQEQVRSLNSKLSDANEQLAAARRRIAELEKQVADLQAELAKRAPRMEFSLLSDVLFTPGSDVLSATGHKALDDVVSKIKALGSDKFIQIEGHTDSDPIKHSNWKSNWELGSARSLAVLHYLTGKGIAPEMLSAATFGQYQPVAPNTTADGKSKNRRSVIVVYTNWARSGK